MIKAAASYFIANVLPQAVAFALLPIYSIYLTTADFGIISAMETVANIFMVFVTLSLYRAASRFYFSAESTKERKIILGTFFWGSILISFIFCLISFLGNNYLSQIFPSISFWPFYGVTIMTVMLTSMSRIVLVYLQVSEQPIKYLGLNIYRTFLIIVSIMLFVVLWERGASGQIWAMFVAAAFYAPLCFYIAIKNFHFTIDWKLLREGLAYSWPFIPTLIMSWILSLSDRIFIERMQSLELLGIYGMGYKISSAFLIVASAISLAYTPVFYRLASNTNSVEAKTTIKKYSNVLLLILLFFALGLGLFAWEIVTFLLDEKYLASYQIIRIIVVSHLLSAILGVSSNLYFYQSKKTTLHMFPYIFASLLNLVLNYFLIPVLGINGAALASVLSTIVLAAIHYNLSRLAFFIPIGWPKILSGLLVGLLLMLIAQEYETRYLWSALLLKISIMSLFLVYLLKNKDTAFFLNMKKHDQGE